ncbi:MAG: ABC transporter substrate-binding protein [Pseudorhodoferax sp.]
MHIDKMHRRLALGGIAGACALLLAPAARAQALVAAHARGSTTLPARPRRVAVYDLAALDMLQALGVDVAGVPKARFPSHLAGYEAERYAKIGSLFEPDDAALKALQPDLIVCGSRSASKFQELGAVAPTIDLSTSTASFLPSVTRNLLLLGRLFDRQAQAAALAEQMLTAVAALQARGARAGKGLLLFVAGQGVSPQAPQTRFGVLYELCGLAPAVTAADLPAPQPRGGDQPAPAAAAAEAERRRQAEQRAAQLAGLLAQRDPDWLFVLDRNAATGGQAVAEKLLAGNPAVTASTAWRKQQVVHLSAPDWYLVGGGVTVIEKTVAQIGAAFDRAG